MQIGLQALVAVESTFNWYWLVDGLCAQGCNIDLADPAQIQQYSGIKHADDKHDAFHLAELQRLKILPKARVYDPELRPVSEHRADREGGAGLRAGDSDLRKASNSFISNVPIWRAAASYLSLTPVTVVLR